MCEHARSMGGNDDAPSGFHRRVFLQLRNLFATLQGELNGAPLPHTPEKIAHVSDLIAAAPLDRTEWGDFTSWRGDRYTRNLVAHDEHFTVLMLCWNKNQRSPIHDHAGSSCWVRVLDGSLRERRFHTPTAGEAPELISDVTVHAGDVTYINDSQGLHEMGNHSSDEVTVTMHVYSPPYFKCFGFDEFTGARRQLSMLAATAPPREILGGDETDEATTPMGASTDRVVLTEFQDMLDNPNTSEADVVEAFSRVRFSREDWSTFAHFSDLRYQRLMLHHSARYSLLMLCWLPGQCTPPHTHVDSKSWVRVLAGELTYTEPALRGAGSEGKGEHQVDGDLPPRRVVVLRRGDPLFVEDDACAVHTVGNHATRFAVSLHLYNPPYTEFRTSEQTVPFVHCQRRHSTVGKDSLSGGASPTTSGAPSPFPGTTSLGQASGSSPGSPNTRCSLSGFYVLVDKLLDIFRHPDAVTNKGRLNIGNVSETIMRVLEAQQFEPHELDRYWTHRQRIDYRVKLHEGEEFDVVLNLWEPGHRSVVHDHDGAATWVKVLRGSLLDIAYDEDEEGKALEIEGTVRAREGTVLFHGPRARHALRNEGTEPAVSLHVASPGGKGCKWFTLAQPRNGVRVMSVTVCEGPQWNITGPMLRVDKATGNLVTTMPLDYSYCI